VSKLQKKVLENTLFDEIAAPAASDFYRRFENGFSVRVGQPEAPSSIQVDAPDGSICIAIKMTQDGPQLELSGQSLSLSFAKLISVAGEDFELDASRDIQLRAGGKFKSEGFTQEVRSTRGDVRIVANDDVRVDGERIQLNSPYPPGIGQVEG